LKIITCNVNGIRSAHQKGFFEWVKTLRPDFICLQETKAQLTKLELSHLDLENYHRFEHDAVKPGYSGVAIYTPHKPLKIETQLGFSCADTEGRFILLQYPNYNIISLYLPSGTSGDHRQSEKYAFMEKFENIINHWLRKKHSFIICGDWNIAHKNIDIKNWRSNQKNSGFLPQERAWLDKLFNELGLIDLFREINNEPDQYTWWSNRANAYQNNVGWRIDYQIASPDWKQKIISTHIYKEQKFSDHAPLIMDYKT
jgi:exodeoxyribonuclease-3